MRWMWFVWLAGMALLMLLIVRHPQSEIEALAKNLCPAHPHLPLPIVMHQGLARFAGYAFAITLLFGVIAIFRRSEAVVLLPLAVAVSLSFFAFHTFAYSRFFTEWLRAGGPAPAAANPK